MGIGLRASSVWSIRKRHGINPSPWRSGPSWAEFLSTQAKGMMACDFLSVDTVLLRRLYWASSSTSTPGSSVWPASPPAWVTQRARNLSFELSERTTSVKFMIRDRDGKLPRSFDQVFSADGIRVVKTPVRAPRPNASCERVIGALRRQCLDRILILGRSHLEAVLAEYVCHYNDHRPHRSLAQRCPRFSGEPDGTGRRRRYAIASRRPPRRVDPRVPARCMICPDGFGHPQGWRLASCRAPVPIRSRPQ